MTKKLPGKKYLLYIHHPAFAVEKSKSSLVNKLLDSHYGNKLYGKSLGEQIESVKKLIDDESIVVPSMIGVACEKILKSIPSPSAIPPTTTAREKDRAKKFEKVVTAHAATPDSLCEHGNERGMCMSHGCGHNPNFRKD